MLRGRLALASVIVAVTACHRFSHTEQDIVGTWVEHGVDYTTYYHCHSDHSFVAVSPTDPAGDPHPMVTAKGTWRIEGNDLIIEFAPFVDSHGREPIPKRVRRSPIKEFTEKSLITEDGWHYERAASIEAAVEPLPTI
jgi:hypothetical protein